MGIILQKCEKCEKKLASPLYFSSSGQWDYLASGETSPAGLTTAGLQESARPRREQSGGRLLPPLPDSPRQALCTFSTCRECGRFARYAKARETGPQGLGNCVLLMLAGIQRAFKTRFSAGQLQGRSFWASHDWREAPAVTCRPGPPLWCARFRPLGPLSFSRFAPLSLPLLF